ncbi:MAG: phosphonopyruvate decarboxylase [Acidimicrobiales bacterium]
MEPAWVDSVWSVFGALGLQQLAYVPDAGLAALIRRAEATSLQSNNWPDRGLRAVPLSTEEEGVALLAGAWLGGQRGALLMQSSGVGNCINMLSLAQTCRFPLLAVVTMRGQWGERNPWQVPMGSTAATVLRAAGMLVFEVDTAEEVAPTVAAAGAMVFSGPAAAAVLISQKVLGAKAFTPAPATPPTPPKPDR